MGLIWNLKTEGASYGKNRDRTTVDKGNILNKKASKKKTCVCFSVCCKSTVDGLVTSKCKSMLSTSPAVPFFLLEGSNTVGYPSSHSLQIIVFPPAYLCTELLLSSVIEITALDQASFDPTLRGETMRIASSEFADDPCSSVKRGTMVRAARALLSAVTRLLILADMADVMRLLSHLKIVEEALEAVKNATNEQDLANRFKEFGKEMVKLNYVAARRQQVGEIGNVSGGWELKDPHCRDEMAAARGALKKNATMLYTASQAFLRHPDVAATRANRDYVFKQVQEAIAGISSAAQATSPTDEAKGHTGIGELAAALNEFDSAHIQASSSPLPCCLSRLPSSHPLPSKCDSDGRNKIILDPMTFSEARFRPSLEERLESIISGAALMADSSCTRDDRRERIVAECNAVRQALQDLLSEYMNNDVCEGMKHLSAQDLVYHYTSYFCHANGSRGHLRVESTLIQASRTGYRDVITGKMEESILLYDYVIADLEAIHFGYSAEYEDER
ncbi:hypothetical protein ACRRTK_005523 [Alexandromys fortis]